MSPREASKELDLSVRSVYLLCRESKLSHLRIGPGRGKIVLTREHLDEYRASCLVPARAEAASEAAPACRPRSIRVPTYVPGKWGL